MIFILVLDGFNGQSQFHSVIIHVVVQYMIDHAPFLPSEALKCHQHHDHLESPVPIVFPYFQFIQKMFICLQKHDI